MKKDKVSSAVIRRLPRYYRHLNDLYLAGVERISSNALGKSMGLTASRIRQVIPPASAGSASRADGL
ncbi:MAG: winged-helix domain-containing protein [Flavonifractor plautii]